MAAIFTTMALTLGCSSGSGDSAGGNENEVTVKGSDTMVHLAGVWAEEYMKEHPDTTVSVTGGGSGTGIAALLNGMTDICNASRKIKDKELQQCKQQGIEAVETIVARDGIVLAVNPENPVKELTVEQIGKIYIGATNNWSELGGPDAEIVVLSRDSSSGTYGFFQKTVLKKKDYRADAKLMPATSAIVQEIEGNKWAIGYVGLGYAAEAADKIAMISVKADADSPAVVPSEETVASGEYSISRPLRIYTAGEPQGKVKEFIEFCLSAPGQEVVRETGYVPVK